jgi:uncharacterized membrane protein YbaN (DUF454 family)
MNNDLVTIGLAVLLGLIALTLLVCGMANFVANYDMSFSRDATKYNAMLFLHNLLLAVLAMLFAAGAWSLMARFDLAG